MGKFSFPIPFSLSPPTPLTSMLSTLILLPLIAAAFIGFYPSTISGKLARIIALVFSVVIFLWSIFIAIQFNPGDITQQFAESLPWVDAIGLNYNLGIDGLSLPLLLLNGLLTCIAIYSSDESQQRPRFYYSLIFLLTTGVIGAFLAQDLLLFFLFYELELIPLYLLIAIWGGARRGYAATKFLIYTAFSGIVILASFLGIVWLSGSSSFALLSLNTQNLPLATQILLLVGILVGFGIKIPLFPFHTWLPDAHVEASDMKKMVAYSSIGHMGYVLLAAAASTPLSVLGAVMQMISHGLISAMLFLLVGVVYKKTGSRDLNVVRGLLNPERGLPLIGSLMIMGVMASAGIPGMVGFISEFIVFRSSFAVFPLQTLLGMLGNGLTAVYFLNLVNRAFFGRLSEELYNLPRVYWSDRLPAIILAVFILIFGIQPTWLAHYTEATITTMVNTNNLVHNSEHKIAIQNS
jgi:NAD(P)H-quinone oxidoreductase subunit 4